MTEKELAVAIEQAKTVDHPLEVWNALGDLNNASSHFNRAGLYDLANLMSEIGIRLSIVVQFST